MQGILVCVVTEIVVFTPTVTLSLTAFLILRCKDRGSEAIGLVLLETKAEVEIYKLVVIGQVLTKTTPVKE